MLLLFLLSLCSFNFITANNSQYNLELLGKVIYIDPGHGGKDNGCVFYSVYEDEINLAISSYLFEMLQQSNYITYITRSDDYDLASLYAKNRKNEDLKRRVKYINESNADIFISIHLNYYEDSSVYGPMVYYKSNCDDSKRLGSIIQSNLNNLTYLDKVIHKGDYYLLNKTKIPGVIVECGFLSNLEERNKLMTNSYQYLLAEYLYNSIREYFEL